MPRRLQMPTEAELPPGPRRDFVAEVWTLWRAARRPDLRSVAAAVQDGQYRGSMSRERFRKTMLGHTVPIPWEDIEAVFEVLCILAGTDLDGDQFPDRASGGGTTRRAHLVQLWNDALDAPAPEIVSSPRLRTAQPAAVTTEDPQLPPSASPREESEISNERMDPLLELAHQLVALRGNAGLTVRELSERAMYSPATISRAAGGRYLPNWRLLEGYVVGCGADPEAYRELWERARMRLSDDGTYAATQPPVDSPLADSPDASSAALDGLTEYLVMMTALPAYGSYTESDDRAVAELLPDYLSLVPAKRGELRGQLTVRAISKDDAQAIAQERLSKALEKNGRPARLITVYTGLRRGRPPKS